MAAIARIPRANSDYSLREVENCNFKPMCQNVVVLSRAVNAKTVLIADDTAFVRDRFGAVLTDAGHQAVLVTSTGELLACVRERHRGIDLLVLDLRLPQSRGIETVRALRQYGARFPILVFSGTIASAEEVRELSDLGVAGFINEYSTPQHILPAIAPHLFPDSFNRRSSPRVALSVTVSYRFENTIASATCANVSKGGMGLRTMNPLPSGTRMRIRFRLPGSKKEIEADATVAWSDQRTGMGLQFGSLDAESQGQLDDYVDRHFFTNRRA